MKRVLTILVSFYNAQEHVKKFINSLKNQSEGNFSCILVEDGSADETAEICKKEIAGDERFVLIQHAKNLGLGVGRFTGIQNSTTEYVTFMDADDEISQDAIKMILHHIEQNQDADMLVFDYHQSNRKGKIKRVTDKSETVDDLYSKKSSLISHVWHKVFKKSLLTQLDYSFYRTISFAEDLWLSTNCFMNAKSVKIIHESYYTYLSNPNSMVHSRSERSFKENIAVIKNLLHNPALSDFPAVQQYIKDDSFYAFGQLIFPNKKNNFQHKPHFEEWRKIDSEEHISVPKHKPILYTMYVSLIRHKSDRLAKCIWNLLYLKNLLHRVK